MAQVLLQTVTKYEELIKKSPNGVPTSVVHRLAALKQPAQGVVEDVTEFHKWVALPPLQRPQHARSPELEMAVCRILAQDTASVHWYVSQGTISPTVANTIIGWLGQNCGVIDAASYATVLWNGHQSLSTINANPAYRVRQRYIDSSMREKVWLADQHQLALLSTGSLQLNSGPWNADYHAALHYKAEINCRVLKEMMAEQHVEVEAIGKLGAHHLLGRTEGKLKPPITTRLPLSEIPRNVPSRAVDVAGKHDLDKAASKTRYTGSAPSSSMRAKTQVISIDSSDDEDSDRVNEEKHRRALRAVGLGKLEDVIAIISERNNHEDEFVPRKQKKSANKATRMAQHTAQPKVVPFSENASYSTVTKRTAGEPIGMSASKRAKAGNPIVDPTAPHWIPSSSQSCDPYAPPPSSQINAKTVPLGQSAAQAIMLPRSQHPPSQDEIRRASQQQQNLGTAITRTICLPPAPHYEPILCDEQAEVVNLILRGHNVFYTGSAGCGKSTVLKAFVPRLRDMGKVVKIVAPTGKAALDINGSTTWTFAGWVPPDMKKPIVELQKRAHGRIVNRRLKGTDVLVIDEISMVENDHFERLNRILKSARDDDRPFGGMQIIVTGDFCQLPPVKAFQYCITCGREQSQRIVDGGRIVHRCPVHGDRDDGDKWAFRSQAWAECDFKHVNLTRIHRQSDEIFIKVLQKLRIGTPLTDADRRLLLDHPCDVRNAVKLFATREEVRRINQAAFDQLPSEKKVYTCLDMFRWNDELHPHLERKGRRSTFDNSLDDLREHRLEATVEYKQGMLVVLLVNLDITHGLVNGSQGRIVEFEAYDPIKLPKAATKLGSTDGLQPGDLRGEYATIREGQIRHFITHPRNKFKQWPVVEFENGVTRTIYADCQVNELGDDKPYTLIARTQIPLIAAWAMTIHKSQGMTLNKVIVDLGRSFEEGQEYVALSRARSLDGLKVEGLGEGVGKGGNKQVRQFLWEKFGLR